MRYLLPLFVAILFASCAKESRQFAAPCVLVAKNNGEHGYVPYAMLRDGNGVVIELFGGVDAYAIATNYNIGDTLK
jgi:hypothetical protein